LLDPESGKAEGHRYGLRETRGDMELHDEVGQALTGVLVEMANLSTVIRARDAEAVAAKADGIKKLVENSIGVVRSMILYAIRKGVIG
jgi:glucose-6-phosphate-specific signal transduction histidine kinase